MERWKSKSCPRCDGDMFTDKDLYGWYEQCLQCGYIRDLSSAVPLEEEQAWSEKESEGYARWKENCHSG